MKHISNSLIRNSVIVCSLALTLFACGAEQSNDSTQAYIETENSTATDTVANKHDDTKVELPLTTQDTAVMDTPLMKRGKIMFLRCTACHTTVAGGVHGTGPNLHGLMGASAAIKEGFNYSPAMNAIKPTWDEKTLDQWIKLPTDVVPGTSMAFIGIESAEDRAALIAYLREVTK